MSKILSIRGATTVESNSREEITAKTLELIEEIFKANCFIDNDVQIINCIISSTKDLTTFYPAQAITESKFLKNVPLFSTLEPPILNSLPLCIRVLMTISCNDELCVKHIYLNGARALKNNFS